VEGKIEISLPYIHEVRQKRIDATIHGTNIHENNSIKIESAKQIAW